MLSLSSMGPWAGRGQAVGGGGRERGRGGGGGSMLAGSAGSRIGRTHLWSEGFSRDSGLKGGGGESEGHAISARGRKCTGNRQEVERTGWRVAPFEGFGGRETAVRTELMLFRSCLSDVFSS